MSYPTQRHRLSDISAAPAAPPRRWRPGLRLAGMVCLLLVVAWLPSLAYGAGPATQATCQGIRDAYQALGDQCANNYARILHAPATAAQRLQSYRARVVVMQIFRKALLCNGIAGADKEAQQRFKSGEAGHLQALAQLYASMAGDPNRPAALFTAGDLDKISMTRAQCR